MLQHRLRPVPADPRTVQTHDPAGALTHCLWRAHWLGPEELYARRLAGAAIPHARAAVTRFVRWNNCRAGRIMISGQVRGLQQSPIQPIQSPPEIRIKCALEQSTGRAMGTSVVIRYDSMGRGS